MPKMDVNLVGMKYEDIRVGDVVHVFWKSDLWDSPELYFDQTVENVRTDSVLTGGGLCFSKNLCSFFLVERPVEPLPKEYGSVVAHEDGWKFVRVGEDRWLGWSSSAYGSDYGEFNDEDVSNEDWTVSSLD